MLPQTNPNATAPVASPLAPPVNTDNAFAQAPDSAPISQPINGAELAANKHRPDGLMSGVVIMARANYGVAGPFVPNGGERAFANQLNGNTYGGAVMGSPYKPLYTLSPYGEPVPIGGTRAPANQLGPAKSPIVIVSPEGPVSGPASPGTASLPSK